MTLIQFPADRLTAHIKRCATELQSIHGEQANQYFRKEMAVFAERLRNQGEAEDEISLQALMFMSAVQKELQRLHMNDVGRQGGSAA